MKIIEFETNIKFSFLTDQNFNLRLINNQNTVKISTLEKELNEKDLLLIELENQINELREKYE